MLKSKAISLLGGTPAAAAKAIGITSQAVNKWPDVLPQRIADRVLAALARERLADLLGDDQPAPGSASFAGLPSAVRDRLAVGS